MYFNSFDGGNLGKAAKSIDFAGILDGCQKTLGIINQAIPIIYQVKPLLSGAKTLFRIADALEVEDNRVVKEEEIKIDNSKLNVNKPIFYN